MYGQRAPLRLDAPLKDKREILKGAPAAPKPKLFAEQDVGAHRTKEDCWIILEGQVWEYAPLPPPQPTQADVRAQRDGVPRAARALRRCFLRKGGSC